MYDTFLIFKRTRYAWYLILRFLGLHEPSSRSKSIMRNLELFILSNQKEQEFLKTYEIFKKCKAARPSLHVSQDAYLHELVLSMIESAKGALRFGRESAYMNQEYLPQWEEMISNLEKLLDQPPPHHTPPTKKASHVGALFFI